MRVRREPGARITSAMAALAWLALNDPDERLRVAAGRALAMEVQRASEEGA
jgi:hypothetical protein